MIYPVPLARVLTIACGIQATPTAMPIPMPTPVPVPRPTPHTNPHANAHVVGDCSDAHANRPCHAAGYALAAPSPRPECKTVIWAGEPEKYVWPNGEELKGRIVFALEWTPGNPCRTRQ